MQKHKEFVCFLRGGCVWARLPLIRVHLCPRAPPLAPHVSSIFLLRKPYYFPYFRLARFVSPTRFRHEFLQDLSCGDPRMCKIGSECAWPPRLEFWHHEVPAVSFRPKLFTFIFSHPNSGAPRWS